MQVINLFAGPCGGKSTLASAIYVELKKAGYNVELCSEYAKNLVYENRMDVLAKEQLYIFANQNHMLQRLENNNLDYAICDSPIILSIIYNQSKNISKSTFNNLVMQVFNSYNNMNFFIERGDYKYSLEGRIHTLEQAIEIDRKIKSLLDKKKITYYAVDNNIKVTYKIIEKILEDRFNRE